MGMLMSVVYALIMESLYVVMTALQHSTQSVLDMKSNAQEGSGSVIFVK